VFVFIFVVHTVTLTTKTFSLTIPMTPDFSLVTEAFNSMYCRYLFLSDEYSDSVHHILITTELAITSFS